MRYTAEDVKRCSKCKEVKYHSGFYRSKATRLGLTAYCKDCINEYRRDRHVLARRREIDNDRRKAGADPEYVSRRLKASRKYMMTTKGKARLLWTGAKHRSLEKGMPFTLTYEHVLAGIERGTCAATGLTFDLTPSKIRSRNSHSPSVDRIDNTKPYSNENVRIVITQFNLMKGEVSDIELYVIAKMFVERFEGK